MFATARRLELPHPQQVTQKSLFLENSKLTVAGMMMCLGLVAICLCSTGFIFAYHAGQRNVEGQKALQLLALQEMVDSTLFHARRIQRELSAVERELAEVRRPRVSRRPPPASIGVGMGPLPMVPAIPPPKINIP